MGTAINYMCTTDSNEEKRSINGTKDFFKKKENNPEKYDKYTSYLQSNYPLLVAVCSTKHNVESISSIVAPAEGFNLTNYKEEVQLTIDTKKQLSKMYERGTLNDKSLLELNERAYQVRQNYVDSGIMTAKQGPERTKQANPCPLRERSNSNYLSPDQTSTQEKNRKRSKSL